MADCTYIYKGKSYSPQRFESLTRQGLIDSIDYVNLGKKISLEDAESYLKSVFGNLPKGVYQFLSMHAMHKLSRPGETLIGLMDQGIMSFLKRTDGTTTDRIIRHETFHRIFNYYLNDAQRKELEDSAVELNPELKGKDSVIIEEHLADLFQDYVQDKPRTLTERIKQFFKNVLGFFNVYANSKDRINGMFRAIDRGFYKHQDPVSGNYNNIRRTLSMNVREFGVTDYMEAIRIIESMHEKHMFESSNLYTEVESFKAIHDSLEKMASQGMALPMKMIEKDSEGDYKHLPKLFGDAFNKDIDNNVFEDTDESTGESFFRDHIQLNDQINQETRINLAVKSFLNYIVPANLRTKEDIKNAKHKRVPPRFAFIAAAQIMDGVDTQQDRGKIVEDIKNNTIELADGSKQDVNSKEDFDNWGTSPTHGNVHAIAVGKKLMRLVNAAFTMEDNSRGKFINENTFYYTEDTSIDVRKLLGTQLELLHREGKVKKFERAKEWADSMQFSDYISDALGIESSVTDGFFKQHQAQDRLASLSAVFTSLYKKNLYVAQLKNDYGNISYKYFPASTDGVKLGIKSSLREAFDANYIKNGKINPKFRVSKTKDRKLAVQNLKQFLTDLGFPNDFHENLTSSNAVTIMNKLSMVYERMDQVLKSKETLTSEQDTDTTGVESMDRESSEGMTEEDLAKLQEQDNAKDPEAVGKRGMSILDVLDDQFNTLLGLMSSAIRDSKPLKTSESVKAADGKRMYLLANSSNAHDVLTSLKDYASTKTKRNRKTAEHLKTPFYAQYNRFARLGSKVLLDIFDHDGTKLFGDYSKAYPDETSNDWIARNLNTAFVDWISNKTLNYEDRKNYIQYLPSMDRGRILGVETPLMIPAQVRTEVKNMLLQMAQRPDIKGLNNYNRSSTINFQILKQLANIPSTIIKQEINGVETEIEAYSRGSQEARKFLSNPSPELVTNSMVEGLMEMMDQNAENFVQQLLQQKFVFSTNLNAVKKALYEQGFITKEDFVAENEAGLYEKAGKFIGKQSKKDGEYATKAEDIRGMVKMFYRNHYVNSYFLSQAVVGDAAFFKDGSAYLKRLDKVFGPGQRGLVNPALGIAKRSRVMIVNSTMDKVLGDVFKDADGNKLKVYGFEFDPNDGQGIMTPERRDEIAAMHGASAKVGNILKPLHYEVVPKRLRTGVDANGNPMYQTVMIPVMLKYSSVVLTPEVVAAFPALEQVLNNMRRNGISEMVFDTVAKVGTPDKQTLISSKDFGSKDMEFSQEQLDSTAFYDISNHNYRLQLNPIHDVDSKTALPSQLIYFLNALTNSENFVEAGHIYNNIAKLITSGAAEFAAKTDTVAKLRQTLIDIGFSKNDIRSAELLKGGLSMNFPVLNNPVIMAYVSAMNKSSTKIKFDGSKLVLQADYGIYHPTRKDKDGNPDRLRIITENTPNGEVTYSEVILPKEYEGLVAKGDYAFADAFGFRIPSSELHSAVPMKIVGFYTAPKANTVIAPRELVALHGSDFDVDSLFILRRSNYKGSKEMAIAKEILGRDDFASMESNYPIGYIQKDGKYIIDPAFEQKLDDYTKELLKMENTEERNAQYREQVLATILGIRQKYWKNAIVEGLIEFSSAKRNAARMLSQIEMSMYNARNNRIEEAKETSIPEDLNKEFVAQKASLDSIFEIAGKSPKTISAEAAEGIKKAFALHREKSTHELFSEGDLQAFDKWFNKEYADGSVLGNLEDIGVKDKTDYDLSDIGGNLQAFNAIFQGNSLVGKFANGMKSTAYSLRSSAENILDKVAKERLKELRKTKTSLETLEKDLDRVVQRGDDAATENLKAAIAIEQQNLENLISETIAVLEGANVKGHIIESLKKGEVPTATEMKLRVSLDFNGIVFDKIQENVLDSEGKDTGRTIWEYFDALLNAAIDNLKEQILSGINASSRTITGWVGMTAMGIDTTTVAKFMRQPIMLAINNYDSVDKGIESLENELIKAFNKKEFDLDSYKAINKDVSISEKDLLEGIEIWKKNPVLNIANLSLEELINQTRMLAQFKIANKVGSGISTLSRALTNTLVSPTKPEDFAKNEEDWAEIGDVISEGDKHYIMTKSSFPFDLTFLFQNVPHLQEAYKVKEMIKQQKEKLFFKYHNKVAAFLKGLDISVKLDYNNVKSKTKLQDEFLKFITSASVEISDNVIPYKLGDETLYGSAAFTQQFATKLELLRRHPDMSNNKFVSSLAIDKSKFNGRKIVKFAGTPNMEYTDILDMENAFRVLNTIEFNYDNGWTIAQNENAKEGEFSSFQREFITYSLLTNGLGFSKSNYNTVLPVELMKEASDKMDRYFEQYKNPNDLARVKDLFEVSLAANYYKTLPRMRSLQKNKLKEGMTYETHGHLEDAWELTEGSEHLLELKKDGDNYNGVFRGMFYDLRFEASLHKDQQKEIAKPKKFIRHFKSNTPYVLVGSDTQTNENNVKINYLYKRLSKNFGYETHYEITPEVAKNGYFVSKTFAPDSPTVLVNDVNSSSHVLPESGYPVVEGLKMKIYSKSDILRLHGRDVRVVTAEKVETYLVKEDKTKLPTGFENHVTVENLSEAELSRENFTRSSSDMDVAVPRTLEELEGVQNSPVLSGTVNMKAAIDMMGNRLSKSQFDALNILAAYIGSDVRVEFGPTAKGVGGTYGWKKDAKTGKAFLTITVGNTGDAGRMGHTFVHEAVHAATSHIIESFHYDSNALTPAQREAVARLMEVYELAQSEFAMQKNYDYGFTSVHEFIAEAFSNPEFQHLLSTVKMDNQSLWQKVVNAILDMTLVSDLLKILGIPLQSKTALAYTIQNAMVIMQIENQEFGATSESRSMAYRGYVTSPSSLTKIASEARSLDNSEVIERIKNCM